jgi:cation/acetate symporter
VVWQRFSTAAGLLIAFHRRCLTIWSGVFSPTLVKRIELLTGKIAMAGAIVVAGYLGIPPGFAGPERWR